MQGRSELKRLFENGAICHAFTELFERLASGMDQTAIAKTLDGKTQEAYAEAYTARKTRGLVDLIRIELEIGS